jgi:hypothetical protein
VSGINVLDAPHLSSCIAQIVCQCALVQASASLPPRSRQLLTVPLQVDNVHAGMIKSTKQQVERGDVSWSDKFTVMLLPHPSQYAFCAALHCLFRFDFVSHCCRYTLHQHVTFKIREVVKPYKKIIGFAAVSLQGAVAAGEKGRASAFMVPLRLQGLVCGTWVWRAGRARAQFEFVFVSLEIEMCVLIRGCILIGCLSCVLLSLRATAR